MVSSKKWGFIKSKQSHGWKYGKAKKLSCRMKNLGRSDTTISTSNTTFCNLQHTDGPGDFSVGKLGADRNGLRGLVNLYECRPDERISDRQMISEGLSGGLANGDDKIRDAT